jgi:hypothetical protein
MWNRFRAKCQSTKTLNRPATQDLCNYSPHFHKQNKPLPSRGLQRPTGWHLILEPPAFTDASSKHQGICTAAATNTSLVSYEQPYFRSGSSDPFPTSNTFKYSRRRQSQKVMNKNLVDWQGKKTEKPEPRTQQQQQQQQQRPLSLIEPPTSPLHGKIQRHTHGRRFLVLTLWVTM